MYITKTSLQCDYQTILANVEAIINTVGWKDKNQIGLNFRPGASNTWFDGIGSLYDKVTGNNIAKESDFTEFNPLPIYLKTSLENLREAFKIKFGRIRLMRLLPHRGLSVHHDTQTRYHYVINTNPKSYFCFNTQTTDKLEVRAQCYHIPADGHWYWVDTTKVHWVYNGGETERIHIVVCAL